MTRLILTTAGMLIVMILLVLFIVIHIRWWTQPWKYQHFTEVDRLHEGLVVSLVWTVIILPLHGLLTATWIFSLSEFGITIFNLYDYRARKRLKQAAKWVGFVFIALLGLFALLSPLAA